MEAAPFGQSDTPSAKRKRKDCFIGLARLFPALSTLLPEFFQQRIHIHFDSQDFGTVKNWAVP